MPPSLGSASSGNGLRGPFLRQRLGCHTNQSTPRGGDAAGNPGRVRPGSWVCPAKPTQITLDVPPWSPMLPTSFGRAHAVRPRTLASASPRCDRHRLQAFWRPHARIHTAEDRSGDVEFLGVAARRQTDPSECDLGVAAARRLTGDPACLGAAHARFPGPHPLHVTWTSRSVFRHPPPAAGARLATQRPGLAPRAWSNPARAWAMAARCGARMRAPRVVAMPKRTRNRANGGAPDATTTRSE